MDYILLIEMGILCVLNVCSSTLSNLKTIFLAKKAGWLTYLITFIDAGMYFFILKQITEGEGVLFAVVYIFSKTLGVIISDVIEDKIALGIVCINLYVKSEELMNLIMNELFTNNVSVTGHIGIIPDGLKRYELEIHVTRKRINAVLKMINKYVDEPTMTISEVKKLAGKLQERI